MNTALLLPEQPFHRVLHDPSLPNKHVRAGRGARPFQAGWRIPDLDLLVASVIVLENFCVPAALEAWLRWRSYGPARSSLERKMP
jgi:hypothetical protein